ncbi:hypothetical protein LX83_003263 [Goodfellowiella coeruleoviolacea]|uniref:Uncharacterized protein n=1 Tax=Goodfellowiella coeruleoviolacea TaxID=334858 RepID=A0AAE3GFH6_9PSEU|nr:hypothetical protein [Goodfellowiella coeruleoviolacea]
MFTPRRVLLVLGCALVFVVCCGLATWQWQRFTSASGTIQNFGYVLLWPLFGVFPTFMWWRMARLNAQHRAAEAEASATTSATDPADAAGASGGAEPGAREDVAAVPAPRAVVPATRAVAHAPDIEDDEDEELAAYNRYLAELNARSERRAG